MADDKTRPHVVEAAGGILWRLRADATAGADPSDDADSGDIGPGDPSIAPSGPDDAGDAPASSPVPMKPADLARLVPGDVLDHIEVCLVHRPKYDDWSWPKGKVDPNETHRHAAVREIGEETGMPVALGPYLGDVEYPMADEGRKRRRTKDHTRQAKHIRYWMATALDAEAAARRAVAFGPVHRADVGEIDQVVWLPTAQARRKLTHPSDRALLALFVDRIQEGAAAAVPFLIVRHAKAEARKVWRGEEAARPITPRGAAAAYSLTYELSCFAPERLASSPWTRCQETLQILSWQTGLPVRPLPDLTEDAYAADPGRAWECLLGEIERTLDTGVPEAVCMHRPVIGGMFAHLRGLCASKSLAGTLVGKTPYMPTGTAMALFVIPTPRGPRIIDIQKVGALVY